MAENNSPEEKLLALIKGKRKKEGTVKAPEISLSGMRVPPNGPVVKKADFADGMLKSDIFKARFFRHEFLRDADKYLVILSLILLFYLMADLALVNPYKAMKKKISAFSYPAGYAYRAARASEAEKDYSVYSSSLSGRQIFGRSVAAPKEAAAEDLSANLSLVGIMPGAKPQAVIENKKSQKVYYVYEGGTFESFTVDEIKEGKVTIDYEGKKIELFL